MGRYADTSNYNEDEQELWTRLREYEGRKFKTARGLPFTYRVAGNELIVDRKEKSVTRSTVNLAFRRAKELKTVHSPKELGVFGASYILPVFEEMKLIKVTKKKHESCGKSCKSRRKPMKK